MAEILVKAIDHTHPDPEVDQRGAYKRGMPVVVMEDGHAWGSEEGLPKFWIIKIPGIAKSQVEKYIQPDIDESDPQNPVTRRRRLWKIVHTELPQAALNRLNDDGILIIKAGAYDGPYDYTWAQVKNYFLNQFTNQREIADV